MLPNFESIKISMKHIPYNVLWSEKGENKKQQQKCRRSSNQAYANELKDMSTKWFTAVADHSLSLHENRVKEEENL